MLLHGSDESAKARCFGQQGWAIEEYELGGNYFCALFCFPLSIQKM